MPKLDRDKALRTLWLAERQSWDRDGWFLLRTDAPEEVWDSYYAEEPSNNFNEWKRRRALRQSL